MKILLPFLAVVLASTSLVAQRQSPDTLVVPGVRLGAITPTTSPSELRHAYGSDNVVDTIFIVEEEELEPGTLVFPNDSSLTLEVFWRVAGADTVPHRIHVMGRAWHTPSGVRLGATLRELERANGRPFTLLGFSWGFAGTVVSWEGGALERDLSEGPLRMWVRLRPGPNDHDRRVMGDREFSSAHEVMQGFNPTVYDFMVEFRRGAR